MEYYCTYFDINFLPRGLALYSSLVTNSESFKLYVLCLDDSTFEYFEVNNYQNIICFKMSDYLNFSNLEKRKFLSKKELYFSITPNWCLFILSKFPTIDLLTYIDADIYFFASTSLMYNEVGNRSIVIAAQPEKKIISIFYKYSGKYNVGLNIFRNDDIGKKCLTDWKYDCDNWQPNLSTNKLPFFSDQIYLDDWVDRYGTAVKVFEHPGINLMPAFLSNNKIIKLNGQYSIKGKPIVAFHFMQLFKTQPNTWNTNSIVNLFSTKGVIKEMYMNYIKVVESFTLDNEKFVSLKIRDNLFRVILKKIFKSTLKLVMSEEIIT